MKFLLLLSILWLGIHVRAQETAGDGQNLLEVEDVDGWDDEAPPAKTSDQADSGQGAVGSNTTVAPSPSPAPTVPPSSTSTSKSQLPSASTSAPAPASSTSTSMSQSPSTSTPTVPPSTPTEPPTTSTLASSPPTAPPSSTSATVTPTRPTVPPTTPSPTSTPPPPTTQAVQVPSDFVQLLREQMESGQIGVLQPFAENLTLRFLAAAGTQSTPENSRLDSLVYSLTDNLDPLVSETIYNFSNVYAEVKETLRNYRTPKVEPEKINDFYEKVLLSAVLDSMVFCDEKENITKKLKDLKNDAYYAEYLIVHRYLLNLTSYQELLKTPSSLILPVFEMAVNTVQSARSNDSLDIDRKLLTLAGNLSEAYWPVETCVKIVRNLTSDENGTIYVNSDYFKLNLYRMLIAQDMQATVQKDPEMGKYDRLVEEEKMHSEKRHNISQLWIKLLAISELFKSSAPGNETDLLVLLKPFIGADFEQLYWPHFLPEAEIMATALLQIKEREVQGYNNLLEVYLSRRFYHNDTQQNSTDRLRMEMDFLMDEMSLPEGAQKALRPVFTWMSSQEALATARRSVFSGFVLDSVGSNLKEMIAEYKNNSFYGPGNDTGKLFIFVELAYAKILNRPLLAHVSAETWDEWFNVKRQIQRGFSTDDAIESRNLAEEFDLIETMIQGEVRKDYPELGDFIDRQVVRQSPEQLWKKYGILKRRRSRPVYGPGHWNSDLLPEKDGGSSEDLDEMEPYYEDLHESSYPWTGMNGPKRLPWLRSNGDKWMGEQDWVHYAP